MKNSFSVEKAISFLTVTGVSKQVLLPGGGGGVHWSPFIYGQLNAFSLVFFNTIIVIGSWIKLPVLLSLRASSPICASEASLMTAREQGRGGSLWLWRWLPHRLSKSQSLSTTTVLYFWTMFTRTIKLNLLLKWLLGSNLSQKYNILDTNILSRGYSTKFQGVGGYDKQPLQC